jgi:hypothetical protein
MVILGGSRAYLEFTECLEGLGVKNKGIYGIWAIYRGLNEVLEGSGHVYN